MNKWLFALLLTAFSTLAVFGQSGKNVEFSYYDRNPTLFLLLLGALVALIITVIVLLLKRGRKDK